MTPSRATHMEGPGGLGASYVSDTDTKEEGQGSRSFQNGPATRELQKEENKIFVSCLDRKRIHILEFLQ